MTEAERVLQDIEREIYCCATKYALTAGNEHARTMNDVESVKASVRACVRLIEKARGLGQIPWDRP